MPEHFLNHPESTEDVISGEIRNVEGRFVSALNGSSATVELPADIGDMMHRMLRIQDKAESRIEIDERTRTLIAMLNCRKTADIARLTTTPRDALTTGREKMTTTSQIREALEDPYSVDEDGILDMLRDCERILRGDSIPALWTPQAERITSQLRDEKFPKIVHVFGPKDGALNDILKKIATRTLAVEDLTDMGFIHTFIILGKAADGAYHCFHKQGPSISEKIEVTSLEDLFAHVFATSMDRQYLSIVGPLK